MTENDLLFGIAGVVISVVMFFLHFTNRIRLSFRAGCYMWLVLFMSAGALFFWFIDLFK